LPSHGLVVFHGAGDVARLSHYFLPRLLLAGQRVLFLDGANSADPRLLERFARERHVPFAAFNRGIQIARAFTCFQLTELTKRVPQFLADFPAQVVIVTAFPDLYFDEDVRDWNARVAFEEGLANLRRWAGSSSTIQRQGMALAMPNGRGNTYPGPSGPEVVSTSAAEAARDAAAHPARLKPCPDVRAGVAIAVFSATEDFAPSPARRRFFPQLCAVANEVWKFSVDADNRLRLIGDPPRPRLRGQIVGATPCGYPLRAGGASSDAGQAQGPAPTRSGGILPASR
jgi:hypothetical protein